MNFVILVSLVVPSAIFGSYGPDEIAKVEKQAIANRLAIQRWHVRIAVVLDSGRKSDMFRP